MRIYLYFKLFYSCYSRKTFEQGGYRGTMLPLDLAGLQTFV